MRSLDDVHDQVRERVNMCFDDMGEIALKNIARPMRVFAISGAKECENDSFARIEARPCRSPTSPRSRCCHFRT